MGDIWVVGEATDSGLARVSAEVATLARHLAADAARDVVGVVVAPEPSDAATELARYVPKVLAVRAPEAADVTPAAIVAERLAGMAAERQPDYVIMGATPNGRDVAGMLSAFLAWGVLVNAMEITWSDGRPAVAMSIFGGRLLTSSTFTSENGIVTVRPNVVSAEPAPEVGEVVIVEANAGPHVPAVRVVERGQDAGAAAPIEEARVIVAGGRGVGGPEGFGIVQELADQLGGAVGATRAAVDAGWINYSQQIGQTGKIVKPALYLALGISGAIQHKVGMQTAETIVAVNRDADAPLAEYADLFVVGDLFEVGQALLSELRTRQG